MFFLEFMIFSGLEFSILLKRWGAVQEEAGEPKINEVGNTISSKLSEFSVGG